MRGRERRLRDVGARMTVRQRVAALLEAGPRTAPAHDDIWRGLEPGEYVALQRYCDRLNQLDSMASDTLAQVASALREYRMTHALSWSGGRMVDTADELEWTLDAWSSQRPTVRKADRDLERGVREMVRVLRDRGEPLVAAGWGDPPFADDAPLRIAILDVHHFLRALAIEVEQCTAEIGADPLHPERRAEADRLRAELTTLLDRLPLDPPMTLTEPSDEVVALMAAHCRPVEGSGDAPW